MVKSKKKKEKNADFKKQRLKAGRTLKKLNETDVSFKTRKVVLMDQFHHLSNSNTQACTHRNLDIDTLVGQLQHYNSHVRKSALLGIKELLTRHTNLVIHNLTRLLRDVLPLLSDTDMDVRANWLPLMQLILASASDSSLNPHFPLLVAHISSGLTHVDSGVKFTALKTLYSILECHPLMVRSSWDLIRSFVEFLPDSGNQIHARHLLSRDNKSSLLTSLCSLLEIALDLSVRVEHSRADDVIADVGYSLFTNSRNCAPFIVPLVTATTWNPSNRPLNDREHVCYFTRKVCSFLHAFWLELSTPEASSYATGDAFCYSDNELCSMLQIMTAYSCLLLHIDAVRASGQDDLFCSLRDCISSVLTSSAVSKIASLFPCSRREGGTQSKIKDLLFKTNLSLARFLILITKQWHSQVEDFLLEKLCEEKRMDVNTWHSFMDVLTHWLKQSEPTQAMKSMQHLLARYRKLPEQSTIKLTMLEKFSMYFTQKDAVAFNPEIVPELTRDIIAALGRVGKDELRAENLLTLLRSLVISQSFVTHKEVFLELLDPFLTFVRTSVSDSLKRQSLSLVFYVCPMTGADTFRSLINFCFADDISVGIANFCISTVLFGYDRCQIALSAFDKSLLASYIYSLVLGPQRQKIPKNGNNDVVTGCFVDGSFLIEDRALFLEKLYNDVVASRIGRSLLNAVSARLIIALSDVIPFHVCWNVVFWLDKVDANKGDRRLDHLLLQWCLFVSRTEDKWSELSTSWHMIRNLLSTRGEAVLQLVLTKASTLNRADVDHCVRRILLFSSSRTSQDLATRILRHS